MARGVSLTGIKPTGEPHLGNYVGAIRPALALTDEYESWYFIADYHALNTIRDAEELQHFTRSVAATWLAAGLDPSETVFYRQSDVPETFELMWVLANVTGKGLMNRAHAYKAMRDRNIDADKDPDDGVNMGLYNYPVLMAADIVIMGADVVPVGRDQRQHVEYTADIAGSYNHVFGDSYPLTIPEVITPPAGAEIPGLDGRKMSKSYGNTIPLFATEAQTKKFVMRIKTDSLGVDEPKDPDASTAFTLYTLFGSRSEVAAMREQLTRGGTGWGDLKKALAAAVNAELAPMRDRYHALMKPDSELDDILATGGRVARARAEKTLEGVRRAIGVTR